MGVLSCLQRGSPRPIALVAVNPNQLAELRRLHQNKRAATNAYHACLADKSPAAVRHKAEQACSTAMAALTLFTQSL